MTDDVNQFFTGGGAPAAKFPEKGTTIEGTVLDKKVTDQTDLEGNIKTFPDGNPMQQVVVTLQTDEQDDEDDDGKRRLFVKGQMRDAVRDALQAAKANLEVGGALRVTYVDDGEPPKRGYHAPKLYEAEYVAPANDPSEEPF